MPIIVQTTKTLSDDEIVDHLKEGAAQHVRDAAFKAGDVVIVTDPGFLKQVPLATPLGVVISGERSNVCDRYSVLVLNEGGLELVATCTETQIAAYTAG